MGRRGSLFLRRERVFLILVEILEWEGMFSLLEKTLNKVIGFHLLFYRFINLRLLSMLKRTRENKGIASAAVTRRFTFAALFLFLSRFH